MMMNYVLGYVRRQFNDVKTIDAPTLASMLESKTMTILVDVRSQDEFEVSRIPGARRIDFKCSQDDLKSFLRTIEPAEEAQQASVVSYCSLGYRSGLFTRRLRDAVTADASLAPKLASDRIFNSAGIFQWASENRELHDRNSDLTRFVHPFSYFWGFVGLPFRRWRWLPEK